jgi:hypothetical protein
LIKAHNFGTPIREGEDIRARLSATQKQFVNFSFLGSSGRYRGFAIRDNFKGV